MPERYRILIVDDDALDRQAIVNALRREAAQNEGAEADIVEVETVSHAREALQREEFACIFLDHHLPDGTSLDLLMEVRAQGLATPVVVLTGQRDEEIIIEVMKAGAVDYLPKERLHPDLVARSLRAALRFLQAQREKQVVLDELRARDRAIAAASNGIVISDPRQPDSPLVYVNQAFLGMTGYSESEVIGRNCRFLQGPETAPEAVLELREAIRQERACQVLILNYRKDGTTFWNEVTVSPVRDSQGALTHFVGIQTDVTNRQKAEIDRRQVEDELRRFQSLVESADDALFLQDAAGRFLYVNAAACRSLGYTAEELQRMRAFDIDPLQDDAAYQVLFQSLDGEKLPPFESLHRRADGTTFPIEVSVSRLDIGGQPLVFSSARDISKRKQMEEERLAAELALQKAQVRTTGILESITDSFFALDANWHFTYLNDQAERLLSRTRADLLGRSVWDEFPAAIGTDFDREYHRAMDEKMAVTFEAHFPSPLDTWFEVRAYPSAEGLSVYFHDITEQVIRRQRERFLADLAERARLLTDPDAVIADALQSLGLFLGLSRCTFADIDTEADTCAIHLDYCADDTVTSIAGVFPLSSFGPFVSAELQAGRAVAVDDVRADLLRTPSENVATYEAIGVRAHVTAPVLHSSRLASVIGAHSATPRHWTSEEISLIQTVVERTWPTVEILRQQRALVREAEERQEAHERTERVLDSLTDAFFTLDRDFRFLFVNRQAESIWNIPRAELLGKSAWEVFPDPVGSVFYRQYQRVMTSGVPESAEEFYPLLNSWLDVRAFPSDDGISVFFQNVTARKMAETERERLLVEQQKRAEREAVHNRISQSIRSATDPEAVQWAAVNLLGEALGADRCYFALYDLRRGLVDISRDWHRAGLSSLQGIYPFENTAEMFRELYGDSNTSVVRDAYTAPLSAQTRANMARLGLRSRISVALVEGDELMATLTAAVAGEPREWTTEEVALVEAVGTQLRTAVETARITQREHKIAEQLQAALQPAVPSQVPGLILADYYRPALSEAGVGGDFSDVFSEDKGVTFLVVGDLSGKGLAAASQVATVRHMLRFALLNGRSVAGAITALSHTLSNHDLLTGFATLFVGRYDAGTRTLTYVNCGQDSGLVLRAVSGDVETLPPTGPVLGAAADAEYEECVVTLEPDDVLALYTDGLTEAGPSRAAMLTAEGVADLLKRQAGETDPQAIVRRVMADVDAYGGAGVRDDQILLVALAIGAGVF